MNMITLPTQTDGKSISLQSMSIRMPILFHSELLNMKMKDSSLLNMKKMVNFLLEGGGNYYIFNWY